MLLLSSLDIVVVLVLVETSKELLCVILHQKGFMLV